MTQTINDVDLYPAYQYQGCYRLRGVGMIQRLTSAVFVVVAVASLPGLLQAQVQGPDSLILVKLYRTTDGPSWNNNANWLTGPVSTWEGVMVEENRVTELWLNHNNLKGSIPRVLGYLRDLRILYMSSNKLDGQIPTELGRLANLEVLWLESNRLSGSIPKEIGDLISLEQLLLGSNQLTDEIPEEMGYLQNIYLLSLTDNELSGSVPASLGNLPRITEMHLSRNQLSGVLPIELSNLTSLGHLSFDENNFTGPIPPELGKLTNLERLWINTNGFSGTLPHELTDLTKLRWFAFYATGLCESLDASFQAWLQNVHLVQSTGCTNVASEDLADVPLEYALEQNYPNPFNSVTTISYSIAETGRVELKAYNILGELVETMENRVLSSGMYWSSFDASGLTAGIYFYTLSVGDLSWTRKMVVVR
ncbi:MAG: hypothetical protein BMS9Abin05_1692 [Rhodothermia bacterium]|nr:MAG: hypothetical protein BMS9Abin05_1692 [Rhodothermia bacterium]